MIKTTVQLLGLLLVVFACQFKQSEINNETNLITIKQPVDSLSDSITHYLIDTVSICLPFPNESFFKLKANNFTPPDTVNPMYYEGVYWYLITNLDSVGPKITLHKELFDKNIEEITKWKQSFTNDITYIINSEIEGGSTWQLYTHCKNKNDFLNTIEPIIEWQKLDSTYYNPEMTWNIDSTTYEPIDGEAGCYYEIKKDSIQNYMLEWYCGC